MDIKKLYQGEIAEALVALSKMTKGSEEYGYLSDYVAKLTDRLEKLERLDNEILNYDENRELEKMKIEIEKMKLELEKWKIEAEIRANEEARKDERTDRFIKNGLTALHILSYAALFVWGAHNSWRWERTDTLTNTPGKEIHKGIFRLKW